MKKILILILSFFVIMSTSNATINEVSFVGGTGGSKILDLNHQENKVSTSGVIYDKDASLVYEISYTNDTSYNKKITGVNLPQGKQLKYEFIGLKNEKVLAPGETVTFKYSITSTGSKSEEQLKTINETAALELSLNTVLVSNPNTLDLVYIAIVLFLISFVCYKTFNEKKVFYGCFILFLLISIFSKKETVLADEKEVLEINTNVKYILSNLAPSCANTNYTGDFCLDWKIYGDRDKVNYLVMEDSKDMKDAYTIGDVNFTLQSTHDVSEQQNKDVILGVYKVNDVDSYLFLVGQDGGVVVPKDASYQFSSYDAENNNSTHDFKYVKYADFSKFYSNKTTNMSYMLTGIGTVEPMEKLDLSGFETSNVTDMSYMFMGVGEHTPKLVLDVSMFDTSNVTTMEGMFFEVGFNSETIELDLSKFNTSNVTDMSLMFCNFGFSVKSIDLNIYNFDTSNVETTQNMFTNYALLAEDLRIDYFKNWNTNKLANMSYMFSQTLNSISNGNGHEIIENHSVIDITGLDTENVIEMEGLFQFNIKLEEIIGLDSLNTSNVKEFYGLFGAIGRHTDKNISLDLSSFNTSSGISGMSIFLNSRLDKVVFKWNPENSNTLNHTFSGARINELVLTGNGKKNITQTYNTFKNFSTPSTLDLSDFNFGASTSYNGMFAQSNVENEGPKTIDLSGSDWNEEAEVDEMFLNVSGVTIYVKDEKAKAFIEIQAPDCTVIIKGEK